MNENKCKPCESTAVQITKLLLKYFGKHKALGKRIFTICALGFFVFCVGLSLGVVGYFIKTYL